MQWTYGGPANDHYACPATKGSDSEGFAILLQH